MFDFCIIGIFRGFVLHANSFVFFRYRWQCLVFISLINFRYLSDRENDSGWSEGFSKKFQFQLQFLHCYPLPPLDFWNLFIYYLTWKPKLFFFSSPSRRSEMLIIRYRATKVIWSRPPNKNEETKTRKFLAFN